jgi:hypothetical protein
MPATAEPANPAGALPGANRARWLLLGAASAISGAVCLNGGEYSPTALALVMAGVLLGAGGIRAASGITARPAVPARPWRLPRYLLWTLALHLAVALAVLRAEPGEVIDVFVFQTGAARALLHGANPYTITHPNIYRDARYYGAGEVVDGRVQVGLPYPPLSLFFVLPGYLLGDVRYAYVAAVMLTALLLAQLAESGFGAAVTIWLLVNPVTFFVEARAWTEPLVLLALCGTVYAALRRPPWLPVALGALLASKQYSVLVLPLVPMLLPAMNRKTWAKLLVQAGGLALAVTAPLALANPRAFWHDTVGFLVNQPLRADALSFTVLMRLPFAAAAGFVLAVMLWCGVGAARRPAMLAAGFGLTFLAACLVKQAFANYYFLVAGAFAVAAAVVDLGSPGSEKCNNRSGREAAARSGLEA